MKWFKHISDSLDDPFIYELMDEFGSDGYVVFFGIIEIYSREFRTENGWKLETIPSYFHKKLLISPKKIKKILSKIHKWEVEITDEKISIFIPKFKELMDESTMKKLRESENSFRNSSGTLPKSATTEEEEEDIKEKEKNIPEKVGEKYDESFLAFWNIYPNKGGSKKNAFKEWKKLNGLRPTIEIIRAAIQKQTEWRNKASPGEFRPEWKDAERWIKGAMWEAEIETKLVKSTW